MNPNEFLTIATIAAGLLVSGAILGAVNRQNFHIRWLITAVALVIVYDAFLTNFWGLLPDVIGGHWNWQGKILATLASLGIAATSYFGWRKSGITFAQGNEPRSATYGVLLVAFLLFVGLAFAFPNEPVDAETLAFQATLPGIDEELFYRGILLLALNEALRGRIRVMGVTLGWGALLTTILFGLAHALAFEAGAFSFDMFSFAVTAIPAMILIWVRERTGSIFWPIVLHNAANTLPLLF